MNPSERRALNNALLDQMTIEQLSSSGREAQRAREEGKARSVALKKAADEG